MSLVAKLLSASGGAKDQYLLVGSSLYSWSSLGFGTKLGELSVSTNDCKLAPNGTAAAFVSSGTASLFACPVSSAGFGVRYTNPASPSVSTGYGVDFHPQGNAIASVGSGSSPHIQAYAWSSSGFGSKFANPGVALPDVGYGVAFSFDGNHIAVAHALAPYITAYSWSSSGFGAKASNFNITGSFGKSVTFHPSSTAIATATWYPQIDLGGGSTYGPFADIGVYLWSSAGAGAKKFDATVANIAPESLAFSPDGKFFAVVRSGFPTISAWPCSETLTFGAAFSNPAVMPSNVCYDVAFSSNSDAIAISQNSPPYVSVYAWSASGFGAKFSNPTVIPFNAKGVSFF